MRQMLWKYLLQFKRLYPTHPAAETWETYEQALADVSDLDLSAACEICFRELTYFPMPAQIRERVRVPDNFLATAQSYPDNPPSDEEKREFAEGMEILKNQLGIRPKPNYQKPADPASRRSDVNYVAMVGSQTLQAWALNQNLSDGLPRTREEINLIKTINEYEKPKSARRKKRDG